MIDIIIPTYNSLKTIKSTLYSIAYQTISDKVTVYIVDDASDDNYDDVINFFSKFIKIKYIKLEKNSGPGVAREKGIEVSKGKYIVFIDSDDILYDALSIYNLYTAINNSSYDVVASSFIEEVDKKYVIHGHDSIWLHGKIYRRSFLKKMNIHFNDSRENEDNGFNQLIKLCGAKIKYIDIKTYIWCDNKKSITRNNNQENSYKLFIGYIYNIKWALEESIKRNGNKREIAVLSFSSLVSTYCHYMYLIKETNLSEITSLARKIKFISEKYPLSKKEKFDIMENQYKSVYDYMRDILLDPIITFNDFLKLLDEVTV